MKQVQRRKKITSHELRTWDVIGPLNYRIQGNRLYGEPDASRLRVSVDDLEHEDRLYKRLADLMEDDGEGWPYLRDDWKHRAVAFANLYGPPADYVSYQTAYDVIALEGIPLAQFEAEATLLWWTLRLRAQLSRQRGFLREALKAVVQIWQVAGITYEGVNALSPDSWYRAIPLPRSKPSAERVHYLRPKEVNARVEALFRQFKEDRTRLWLIAHSTFASILNIRLSGATLVCLPSDDSRPSPGLTLGFQFLTPMARIWYDLWQDLGGPGLRVCAWSRCPRDKIFFPSRKDQRFCSTKCQTAAKVARLRAMKKSSSRNAKASRTSRRPR